METTRSGDQDAAEAMRDVLAFIAEDSAFTLEVPAFGTEKEFYQTDAAYKGEALEITIFPDQSIRRYGGDIVLRLRLAIQTDAADGSGRLERAQEEIIRKLSSWPEKDRVGQTETDHSDEYIALTEAEFNRVFGPGKSKSPVIFFLRLFLFVFSLPAFMHLASWLINWRSIFATIADGWETNVAPVFASLFSLISLLPLIPSFSELTVAYLTVGLFMALSIRFAHHLIGNQIRGVFDNLFMPVITAFVWPIIIVIGLFTSARSDQTTEQKELFLPTVLGPASFVLTLSIINFGIGLFS